LTDLSVSVGDAFVTRVKADGLIVATPTGSTAYNLAAGGPIEQPTIDALVLTPIAPHMLTNRPIVIPATSLVRVQPQMTERDELYVTFDGQDGYELEQGDEVRIQCAERRVRLLRPSTRSYFDVLRQKLKWNERWPAWPGVSRGRSVHGRSGHGPCSTRPLLSEVLDLELLHVAIVLIE